MFHLFYYFQQVETRLQTKLDLILLIQTRIIMTPKVLSAGLIFRHFVAETFHIINVALDQRS